MLLIIDILLCIYTDNTLFMSDNTHLNSHADLIGKWQIASLKDSSGVIRIMAASTSVVCISESNISI
jgi:hypothetical protein